MIALIMAVLVLAATAAVIASFTYTLGMYLEGRAAQVPSTADGSPDLLFVFLIPCLNEDQVIGPTLDRLRSTMPARSVVVVIDDGSDDKTAAIARSRTDERIVLLQRRLPEARQGKGAALNAALRHLLDGCLLESRPSNDVIVCLLDADGRLDPTAPAVASARFVEPHVGAVQVAVRIRNRDAGLLPRLQDMEFVCYTELFQRARSRAGFAGLGGNGQFTRLSALESLGPDPWSPANLTEDLDLGIRLVLSGWRTVYSNQAEVHQQGLTSFRALVRQRSRWFQGLLQCWSLIPDLARRSTGRTRVDLLHMLLTPVLILAAFLMALSFLVGLMQRLADPNLTLGGLGIAPLVAWYVLTFFPALLFATSYRAVSRVRWLRSLTLGHLFVVYGMLWVAAGVRAVWRLLTGRRSWIKTDRLDEDVRATPSSAIWPPFQPALETVRGRVNRPTVETAMAEDQRPGQAGGRR